MGDLTSFLLMYSLAYFSAWLHNHSRCTNCTVTSSREAPGAAFGADGLMKGNRAVVICNECVCKLLSADLCRESE